MKLEIATLEAIDAWSVIDRLDHHVITSTWAFKCKDNNKTDVHPGDSVGCWD